MPQPTPNARDESDQTRGLVLGVGCDRNITSELFERGIAHVLEQFGLSLAAVRCIASIDKKRDEPALLRFAAANAVTVQFFSAAELDAVSGERASEIVRRHVGARAVSEPAALLASGATALLVPKTVYTEPGAGASLTVAVARCPDASTANPSGA